MRLHYTDEALALLNYFKLLMNLWRALRHTIQTIKEAPAKCPQHQLTKGWAVIEEVLNSLQLLLIATYSAIGDMFLISQCDVIKPTSGVRN